jgi:hypothetical protein
MVTIHREGGFRFVIYKDDHEPAHVHVQKDGEVIIYLVGSGGNPEIRNEYGSTNADVRKALQIVTREQKAMLTKWQEIHGGTD